MLIREKKEKFMLHYAVVFLVIALIAAVLGFGGIAGTAAGIAKILFFVFLIIAVLSFVFGRRSWWASNLKPSKLRSLLI